MFVLALFFRYPHRFLSLKDMQTANPGMKAGPCDISKATDLDSLDPSCVFYCPETSIFVSKAAVMAGGAAVVSSSRTKDMELSKEIVFEGARSVLLEVSPLAAASACCFLLRGLARPPPPR